MTARRERVLAFLARSGWADAERRPLAGDASFRRYERLRGPRGRAVLMDAPAPREDVRPFVRVARHLAAIGLGAPAILARDEDAGLLLLEDLGDDLYTHVLAAGAEERPLYLAAVDALIALRRAPRGIELPDYGEREMIAAALLFADWFMPLAGLRLSRSGRADFVAAWHGLLEALRRVPETMILRDYHADNLIWLPDRRGVARVGQLDFQDAARGAVAYDLVSLLQDARRDIAPATVEAALARYLDAFPDLDRDAFMAAYAVAGLQRNLRIAGVFCRLLTRDGKPGYQAFLDRVWAHIATDLAHPATAPMRLWLERWVPPAKRTRAA